MLWNNIGRRVQRGIQIRYASIFSSDVLRSGGRWVGVVGVVEVVGVEGLGGWAGLRLVSSYNGFVV